MSKDRKLVLVVDDDPGMLRSVQRLLRQQACEPAVFSSAQAFKSHTDFEKAVCVILILDTAAGPGLAVRRSPIHDRSVRQIPRGFTRLTACAPAR